jgi:hypothetical protein
MASLESIKGSVLGCIKVGFISLILVLAVTAGYAGWYVYCSWENPSVREIIFGSIAITLLLGFCTTFFSSLFSRSFREPGNHNSEVARSFWSFISILLLAVGSVSLLAIVIAFLVYESNTPRSIKREIPVSYLIDMSELQIASDLEITSSDARQLYEDAISLFRNFSRANTGNGEQVRKALLEPGRWFNFGVGLFRDLTQILIPHCIGVIAEQGDMEPAIWRGEHLRWEGWPDRSISGTNIDINDIEGGLARNLFFSVPGSESYKLTKTPLGLPKGTRVCLLPTDTVWSSTYLISNDFVEIKMRVQVFCLGTWFRLTSPAEPAFRVSLAPTAKRRGPFYRVDTMIYYEATFSKWRYSFSDMRHYEEWANDLSSLLERRFSWGSPPLLDDREVMRQYKQQMEQK